MNAANVLPFSALGAICGLDVVSFPQAMISRPLVAATVAGAFAGDAQRGLLIGAVLEMVALGTLPFGASRYPDWGSASVVGGALYASGDAAPPGHLALAVLATLTAAWLSGQSMVWLRRLNVRTARAARADLATGSRKRMMRLQLRGLTSDVYAALGARWGTGAATERALLAGLTAALGSATIWMLVRGTTRTRALIVIGLATGIAFAL
jgi:PTS system mannose-specific IIC component